MSMLLPDMVVLMPKLKVNYKPCVACPYRKDCPSGLWDRSEYEKLPTYDNDTCYQPTGVFLCHDADRKHTVCKGWLDVHDKNHLLSLRLASFANDISDLMESEKTDVPLFKSGAEAHKHGIKDIECPSKDTLDKMQQLIARHPDVNYNKTKVKKSRKKS